MPSIYELHQLLDRRKALAADLVATEALGDAAKKAPAGKALAVTVRQDESPGVALGPSFRAPAADVIALVEGRKKRLADEIAAIDGKLPPGFVPSDET